MPHDGAVCRSANGALVLKVHSLTAETVRVCCNYKVSVMRLSSRCKSLRSPVIWTRDSLSNSAGALAAAAKHG